MARSNLTDIFRNGIIAGAAGGLTEVVWVLLYAAIAGGDAGIIARGVTTGVGINAIAHGVSVAAGVFIHMALAIALGIALAFAWRSMLAHGFTRVGSYLMTILMLAGVWAFNFFVLLPAINPAFVSVLPYPASLVSKLLFGLAAAEIFRQCTRGSLAEFKLSFNRGRQ